MEQSGFNAEQNQNAERYKSYTTLWLNLKTFISPLFRNPYALVTQVDNILLPHTAMATSHADNFFTSNKSFLIVVPPVAPFVGVSDIGQGYCGPETGNWVQESNPVDLQKRSCC